MYIKYDCLQLTIKIKLQIFTEHQSVFNVIYLFKRVFWFQYEARLLDKEDELWLMGLFSSCLGPSYAPSLSNSILVLSRLTHNHSAPPTQWWLFCTSSYLWYFFFPLWGPGELLSYLPSHFLSWLGYYVFFVGILHLSSYTSKFFQVL